MNPSTPALSSVVDVTQLGARGDGRTLATAALQQAIDQVHAAGGGVVVVPAGTFLTGALHLKSFVTLDLHPAARLLGSPDIAHYPPIGERRGDRHQHHLLHADGAEHVTIRGGGTIDGNGPAFWKPQQGPRAWIGAKSPRVSPMIELRNCRDLRIADVHIVNSPGWTVHLFGCDHAWLRGIKLVNHMFGPNTDGFDLNGCRDVMMSDCYIECGDDAIVLKTSRDSRSCERITVTNCVIKTNCVALKCGTESWHDYRQIAFSNCVVFQSTRAVGLYMLDGATIEDVVVSNLVCDTDSGCILNRPIHVDLRKRDPRPGEYDSRELHEQPIGRIRNVQISNVVARSDGRVLMTAADGGRLENVVLRDVRLSYPLVDDPAPTGGAARSAQFSNHSPEARVARAAVVVDHADNLVVAGLQVDWPAEPPRAGTQWAGAERGENGANTQFRQEFGGAAQPAEPPPFSVLWAREVRGGLLDNPLARPLGSAPRYALHDCDVTTRD